MLKLFILSFLNLLFILYLTKELKGVISFILNIHAGNIHNYILGIVEIILYYLLSLSIILLSKYLASLITESQIIKLFLFFIICLFFDIIAYLFIFRSFFIT